MRLSFSRRGKLFTFKKSFCVIVFCLLASFVLFRFQSMKISINETVNNAVEITAHEKLTEEEIIRLFGKYGSINNVISDDEKQTIYFSTPAEAEECVNDARKINPTRREVKLNLDCEGDSCHDHNVKFGKMKRAIQSIKSKCSKLSPVGSSQLTPNDDTYTPNCSSPVLLNTVEPGFRMAYCHNLINLKATPRIGKLNHFNRSIKKYMDDAPRVGTQELVLTNLPPNFREEDVYRLCGKIEPAAVELKTTSNINILYANVKAKSKDDFEKLAEVLGNQQVNGAKITTIPVTKITPSDSSSFDNK